MAKKILITGPVEHLSDYSAAARAAGWEPIEFPLLEMVPVPCDPIETIGLDAAFDWICVTNSNALAFVEACLRKLPNLRRSSAQCVGEHAAERLRALGLDFELDPATSAMELAEIISAHAVPRAQILWPRGDGSNELADTLRKAGFRVSDPVVYSTRPSTGGAPALADAVFLTSPGALQAWKVRVSKQPGPKIVVGISKPTIEAVMSDPAPGFERGIALPAPVPEAFTAVLEHIDRNGAQA